MDYINNFAPSITQTFSYRSEENVNYPETHDTKKPENARAEEETPPSSLPSSVESAQNLDGYIGSRDSMVSTLEELEYGTTSDDRDLKEDCPMPIRKYIRHSNRKPVGILSYDSDDEVKEIIDRVDENYESNKRTMRTFLKQSRTPVQATPKSVVMSGMVTRLGGKTSSPADGSEKDTLSSASVSSEDNGLQKLYSGFERRRHQRQMKRIAMISFALLCLVTMITAIVVALDIRKPDIDEKTLLAQWGINKWDGTVAPSKQPSRPMATNPPVSQVDPHTETPSESPIASPLTPKPTKSPSKAPFYPQTNAPTASPVNPPTSPPSASPSIEKLVTTFYVIGDLPYNDYQRTRLIDHSRNVPDDAEFLVHVGDIRNADHQTECLFSEFADVANILKQSKVPVLIIPGDNEYNDCPNLDESWGYWTGLFGGFEKNWRLPFKLNRDSERQENFYFIYKRVLYIGLNIVGGARHDYSEWEGRLSHQFGWTKDLIEAHVTNDSRDASSVVIFAHADPTLIHSTFFGPLQYYIRETLKNEIPIIYINGDKHYFQFDTEWYGQESMHRIMVEGGSMEPPLKMKLSVPINADHGVLRVEDVYTFDRQL